MLSESALISLIARRYAGGPARKGDLGIGDDSAVLRFGSNEVVVTTDLLIEGVHFDLKYAPPYLLGRKAAAVSLSDIAAMGASPRGLFVSAAIPRRMRTAFTTEILEGISDEARAAGVPVMGGDTSASPGPLVLDTIAVGDCGACRPILRSGARPGDLLYVSGFLGASARGLELLRKGLRPWSWRFWSKEFAEPGRKGERKRASLAAALAHLLPQPRLALGRMISAHAIASAMIDVSDGLATDLHNLCEASGRGARIEEGLLPLHPSLRSVPRRAIGIALSGGEDYELLFTVPARKERTLLRLAAKQGHVVTRIGRITANRGKVELVRAGGRTVALPRLGYEHFKARPRRHPR